MDGILWILPVITRPNLFLFKVTYNLPGDIFLFVGIFVVVLLFLIFFFFCIVTFFLYIVFHLLFSFTLWLSQFTVLLGCCTFWSTHLEIKLLQPHGCLTAERCGHGTSKLLGCTLDLGFTPLCSLNSSSSLRFSFT